MKHWLLYLPLVAALMIGKTVMADELQIEILTAGDGVTAEAGKTCPACIMRAVLTDGSVFDASRPRGQPFAFYYWCRTGSSEVGRQAFDGMQVG